MYGKLKVGFSWSVIEVDYGLGKYLRSLFYISTDRLIKLQQPSNQEHITLISPYDSYNKTLLRDYNGLNVEFEIVTDLYTNGNAYWVPVFSKQADKIREAVGLGKPGIPLHFCVGYKYIGKVAEGDRV